MYQYGETMIIQAAEKIQEMLLGTHRSDRKNPS
jgi:hypothetical protein